MEHQSENTRLYGVIRVYGEYHIICRNMGFVDILGDRGGNPVDDDNLLEVKRKNKMKMNYKVVFKMEGGTVVKMKEFSRPAGVVFCVTHDIPSDATEVSVEDLRIGAIATHELKNHALSRSSIEGIKAFLGGEV